MTFITYSCCIQHRSVSRNNSKPSLKSFFFNFAQRQHRSRHEELKERARVLLEAARKEAAMKKVVIDATDAAKSPTSPADRPRESPTQPQSKALSEVVKWCFYFTVSEMLMINYCANDIYIIYTH